MTVETDQTYQETVEETANMLCRMKQRDDHLVILFLVFHINKWYNDMSLPNLGEVTNVYRYHLLEYIGFGTGIYDRDKKMRVATLLGDILRLHQCTKNSLKYVYKISHCGHVVAIPSFTQESF